MTTTLAKRGAGRAVPRSSSKVDNAKSDHLSISENYAEIAKELVGADNARMTGIAEAEAVFQKAVLGIGNTMVQRVAALAKRVGKCTPAQWDEYLKEPVEAAYTAINAGSAKMQTGNMKWVFIGYSYGFEVPEEIAHAFYKVRDHMRQQLVDAEVVEPKVARAKSKKAAHTSSNMSDAEEASLVLAGEPGDDDIALARAEALRIATKPANWKLFQKLLRDMMKKLGEDELAEALDA